MTEISVSPTREEAVFHNNELMVTQSDLNGELIYCNDVYCRVMETSTADILGKTMSFTWHPDMPRSLIKRILETDPTGRELFLYIKHITKTGKYVWVLAQVSPLFDGNDEHIGYNSVRRSVKPEVIAQVADLYRSIKSEEQRHDDPDAAILAGETLLNTMLTDQGHNYPEFIWSTMDAAS
ncbi:MAG: PAS domain-containing protein [Porticoccaceae bacterium]|nr:PAS domain-containing protein [Porticoccaceae bacterium]